MSAPVTVAVVSWNTRELLASCLSSLAAEAEAARASVWVVDNGSTDGSAEMVAADFRWVELLRPAENLGFGRAVNLVASRSESPWLVAANADVELVPGALEALLEAGEHHREAAVIAPRLVPPDGSTQHSVYRFPTLGFSAAVSLGLHQLSREVGDRLCMEGRWDAGRPRRVDWAIGAFLLIRRRAFEAVGGFDPEQWMYAEDLDLGWRLASRGWTTRYEPAAVVRHAGSAAVDQAFGDELARRERWMAATYAWMARRRGVALTSATAAVNAAGAAARVPVPTLLARLGVRSARWPRDDARHWTKVHLAGLRSAWRLSGRLRASASDT